MTIIEEILNRHNIEEIYNQSRCRTFKQTQKSRYYPTYDIEEKLVKIENIKCQLFKISQNNKIDYYITDFEVLEKGLDGFVHYGQNIATKEVIAIKYGNFGPNEINSLIKTDMYIAHSNGIIQNILLMKKAPGISYRDIIKNEFIPDETKIRIHKLIIKKFSKLSDKHDIYHGNLNPKNIFVDINNNYQVTFTGFKHSMFLPDVYFDINKFNGNTAFLPGLRGGLFQNYVSSIYHANYVTSKL